MSYKSFPISIDGRRRRRQESLSSCQTTIGQVEIQGQANLYFSENHSWFQGTISTDGESNYSLYGEALERALTPPTKSKLHSLSTSSTGTSTPYDSDEEYLADSAGLHNHGHDDGQMDLIDSASTSSSSSSGTKGTIAPASQDYIIEGAAKCYRMTLTDEYTGLIYNFPKIIVNRHANGDQSFLLSYDDNTSIQFRTENVYKGQRAAMIIQRTLGSSSLLGKHTTVYSGDIQLEFPDNCIAPAKIWSL